MSLDTYANLKTAVDSWLARGDLSANDTDWITLFEACANRRLRVRQMLLSTTLTPASGSATIPTDYLEWKRVTWTGSVRQELEWVEPTELQSIYPVASSSPPNAFTIENTTLKINSSDTTGLEFVYYQKIPALSDSATTNWLLTAHPDLYLAGALAEAAGFTKDPEALVGWITRRDQAFSEIERLSRATQGQARMRAFGRTP